MVSKEYMNKLSELIDLGLNENNNNMTQLSTAILLTLKASLVVGGHYFDRLSNAVDNVCRENLEDISKDKDSINSTFPPQIVLSQPSDD